MSFQLKPIVLMGFLLLLSSCATYQSKVQKTRNDIVQGRLAESLDELKSLAENPNDDQLVHLLDYGVALQMAGQYKESNKVFLTADKLAEEIDYHSISRIAGSVLASEEMKQYKGDTFEKIFINAYLALNFLELGDLDGALVEAKRINDKYLKYRADEKKNFEMNSFSKFLSALVWEADKKYDDAFLAYKEAASIDQKNPFLQSDLLRSAKLARREDEYQKIKGSHPSLVENPAWYDKNKSDLVVLIQQGWGPRKAMSYSDHTFPVLNSVYSDTRRVRVVVDGEVVGESEVIYSVDEAAIATLKDDYAALVARRIGSRIAKDVAADQIRQRNGELAGFIAWVVMHASDRADLRQWSFLPQSIQLFRLRVKPGKHKVELIGLDSFGQPSGESRPPVDVEVRMNKTQFINWRTVK